MAPLDLSAEGLTLLEALEQAPEGTPLAGLGLDWPGPQIAAVARELLRQRVLLLQPGSGGRA